MRPPEATRDRPIIQQVRIVDQRVGASSQPIETRQQTGPDGRNVMIAIVRRFPTGTHWRAARNICGGRRS
jgi:hypothetical protein